MSEHYFEGLDGRPRSEKPRATGLTMVIDWGIGPNEQHDLVVQASAHFELAKVAVGVSRLLPNDYLSQKLRVYLEHDIEPFPGGMFLEYAEVEEKTEAYFEAVCRAGYRCIEVSDNMAEVTLEWKQRMIRRAIEEFDLRVIGEVGKKEGLHSGAELKDDAKLCLDTGSSIVLLEAAELIDEDEATTGMVEGVVEAVGLEKVMFELPGPWIEGINGSDIHRMRRQLVDRYGPEVNIGNVAPSEIIPLEAYRRGLGVNAGKRE